MVEKRKEVNKITDIRELAVAYHDEVAPYFDAIRYHIDKLELIVEDDMWPLLSIVNCCSLDNTESVFRRSHFSGNA